MKVFSIIALLLAFPVFAEDLVYTEGGLNEPYDYEARWSTLDTNPYFDTVFIDPFPGTPGAVVEVNVADFRNDSLMRLVMVDDGDGYVHSNQFGGVVQDSMYCGVFIDFKLTFTDGYVVTFHYERPKRLWPADRERCGMSDLFPPGWG